MHSHGDYNYPAEECLTRFCRYSVSALNEQKILAAHKTLEIEKQHVEGEEKMKQLRAQRTECQHHMEQIKTVRSRMTMTDRKIKDLQEQRTSIEEIKESNKKEINVRFQLRLSIFSNQSRLILAFDSRLL